MMLTSTKPSHEDAHDSGHFVQFYESDTGLMEDVGRFLLRALNAGGSAIAITTADHLASLTSWLDAKQSARTAYDAGKVLILLDAHATLERFMVDGWPDETRFVSTVVAKAAQRGEPLHAFGEMVALLCEQGQGEAALRLEELWNRLAERHRFSLFCGYPDKLFPSAEHTPLFRHICHAHHHVLPGSALRNAGNKELHLRLALAEQRARSLEDEMNRRKAAEHQRDTDREVLLSELREANGAKDAFLAMLGHDLRNPRAPIVSALELMERRGTDSTARERAVIQRHVDHLARLVDDLLDVSRMIRGNVELDRQLVDVHEVVVKAVEMTRVLVQRRAHRLNIEVDGALKCLADPARLVQAIANLLINAARYTEPGGVITVSAAGTDADTLRIGVRDTGIGIAPDALPRIFDILYQGTQTIDRAHGGLGIGLALARNFVELHGGHVEAASGGRGCGSQFTIVLPCAPSPAMAGSEQPATRIAVPAPLATRRPERSAGAQERRVLLVRQRRCGGRTRGTAAKLRPLGNDRLRSRCRARRGERLQACCFGARYRPARDGRL
ncbi:MAG: Chemotaxis protein methyltransferase CheR (EC [uncultured Paraburkholderia sp.]|nr:MAG: Chemotaxis protein methyltransferase CheR (EC [uncultured Paraburkholderia sp.]CAH2941717.1 MAG: Chemotaxis protein methyltransferase CheR (EC [uncultured Paraburkholderia sp.]